MRVTLPEVARPRHATLDAVELDATEDRARDLLRVLASLTERPEPAVSARRFESGGHAVVAEYPSDELWRWRDWLWQQRQETGLVPVIVENPDWFDPGEGNAEEVLAAADALAMDTVVNSFRRRGRDRLEFFRSRGTYGRSDLDPEDPDFWRDDEGEKDIPLLEPRLALFPVERPCDIFAEVGYGVGNTITAAEHLTMARYLEEEFRIELVSISGDGYGLLMTEPLSDRGMACDLATVLIGYANSAVPYGGRDRLSELASYLMVGDILRLWWD
jgi:Domain of unknown function (DUF4253)